MKEKVEAKTVSLGDGTNPAISVETVWNAGNIPSSLIIGTRTLRTFAFLRMDFGRCV